MKIGINSLCQIKQIREITDTALTIIELDETIGEYPFTGWSDTRILCYCYKADGNGVSVYPYIDTNLIERLDADEERSSLLKIRTVETETVARNNGLAQQELLELLIDMGVL